MVIWHRNVKFSIFYNKRVRLELLMMYNDVEPIKARMMQKYDFQSTDTFSTLSASTDVQPSEQVVQNIIGFACSCQVVEVGGMPIELFLN